MARTDRSLEIDGEGAFWAVAGFAASILIGVVLLASLGGRATRKARVEAREEADVLTMLTAVNLAAARGGHKADQVAAEGLRDLLDARAVRVVREGPEGDLVVAAAGQVEGELDLERLPHLDEEGRIPSGHLRSVGGTLVLPAQGVVVDLVRRGRRVGPLVIVPAEDRPILRMTRLAIAGVAHALAMAR